MTAVGFAASADPAPTLVGRCRELATLRESLGAALAGRGSLVLIGGEAGIGKTALAQVAVAEAADMGALILVGRCYDLNETPPYGPWAEALSVSGRDTADRPPPPDLSRGDSRTSQAALFAAVRDYLDTLASSRPLVLLLDDLHWADQASLDLLRFVSRGLGRSSILLLATYRTDALMRRHPLYQLLPVLERETRAVRLGILPLDQEAIRALVAGYALPPGAAERLVVWLVGRAEGNAFFTAQLLRALEDEGVLRHAANGGVLGNLVELGLPVALRQVLDARLVRLGEGSHRLLTLAAIIGQEVPLALWAAVAATDEDDLLDTIDAASDAHLLTVARDGTAVRFAHALVRETLYEGLVPTRRRRVHHRVAEALLAYTVPDPDALANHLHRAGDARAAEWLVRAGERAQRAYAWRTAAARFEAALALTGPGDGDTAERRWLLVRLARFLRFADPARGVGFLDEAVHLAEAVGDEAIAATARSHRGILRCFAGDVRGGLADMAAGADALDALPDDAQARLQAAQARLGIVLDGSLRSELVVWLGMVGRYAEAAAMGARVVAAPPAPPGLDDVPQAAAWFGLGYAHSALGRPTLAREAFGRARELYRAAGHHWLVGTTAFVESVRVTIPYATTDLAARRHLAATVEEVYERLIGIGDQVPPTVSLARLRYLDGRWAEARQATETFAPDPYDRRGAEARLTDAPIALGYIARAQGTPPPPGGRCMRCSTARMTSRGNGRWTLASTCSPLPRPLPSTRAIYPPPVPGWGRTTAG